MATLPQLSGLRIQAYIWHATAPFEREAGAHKIQITLPGAPRGAKVRIYREQGRLVLFCGFASEFDTWVLWDAALFMLPGGISYSRNLQVSAKALTKAVASGISVSTKKVRGTIIGPTEATIVSCRRSHLVRAIEKRFRLGLQRSISGTS